MPIIRFAGKKISAAARNRPRAADAASFRAIFSLKPGVIIANDFIKPDREEDEP